MSGGLLAVARSINTESPRQTGTNQHLQPGKKSNSEATTHCGRRCPPTCREPTRISICDHNDHCINSLEVRVVQKMHAGNLRKALLIPYAAKPAATTRRIPPTPSKLRCFTAPEQQRPSDIVTNSTITTSVTKISPSWWCQVQNIDQGKNYVC